MVEAAKLTPHHNFNTFHVKILPPGILDKSCKRRAVGQAVQGLLQKSFNANQNRNNDLILSILELLPTASSRSLLFLEMISISFLGTWDTKLFTRKTGDTRYILPRLDKQ